MLLGNERLISRGSREAARCWPTGSSTLPRVGPTKEFAYAVDAATGRQVG